MVNRTLLGAAMFLLGCTTEAAVLIPVLPVGDGTLIDLPGTANDSFSSTAATNQAHYSYYGTSDTYEGRTAWAQFSLAGLTAEDIASATLNLNILSRYLAGSTATCGYISHRANSATANGNASQRLSGNQEVTPIFITTPLGWNSFDVTTYIINDVTAGYSWAAFSFERDATGDYDNRNAGYSFSSGDTASAPYLAVEVVPEPGIVAMGAGTVLGILNRRRRESQLMLAD